MRLKHFVLLSVLTLLTACTGKTQTEEPVTKEVEVINVEDVKENAKDYDRHYIHTLLRTLAEAHEELPEDVVARYEQQAEQYFTENNLEVTPEMKKNVVESKIYEEQVFLRIMDKDYSDLEQEVNNGTDIYNVMQFVFLDTDKSSDMSKEYAEKLKGVTQYEEIQEIYAQDREAKLVEVSTTPYTAETLPDMFQDVLALEKGQSMIIGDETISGLLHLQMKTSATLDTLLATYQQHVVQSFPSSTELVLEYIKKLPIEYKLGDGVEELLFEEVEIFK